MKLFLIVLAAVTLGWGAEYKVDALKSSIAFETKKVLFGQVRGSFRDFEGTFDVKEGRLVSVEGTVAVRSIDTDNSVRDTHLLSSDFFDADRYKTIRFVSKSVGADTVTADVTIHGITKSVTFHIEEKSVGAKRVLLKLQGWVNRAEFHVDNHIMSSLMSNDVELKASLYARPFQK